MLKIFKKFIDRGIAYDILVLVTIVQVKGNKYAITD